MNATLPSEILPVNSRMDLQRIIISGRMELLQHQHSKENQSSWIKRTYCEQQPLSQRCQHQPRLCILHQFTPMRQHEASQANEVSESRRPSDDTEAGCRQSLNPVPSSDCRQSTKTQTRRNQLCLSTMTLAHVRCVKKNPPSIYLSWNHWNVGKINTNSESYHLQLSSVLPTSVLDETNLSLVRTVT